MENNLPKGWTEATLKTIADARMGETILAKELTKNGVPVYSAGQDNSPWGFLEKPKKINGKGTIVVSARGSIGFPKIPANDSFASTQTTITLKLKDEKLTSFCCLWLRMVNWNGLTKGGAIPMLTVRDINKLVMPLPPDREREKILSKLELLLPKVKDAQFRLDKIPLILGRFRQSILTDAFSGELTRKWRESNKIDDSWPSSFIEPLLSKARQGLKTGPFGSALKKLEHMKEGVPVLGIENISEEGFIDGNKIFITKEKARELNKFDLRCGDVIISRSGTVGEVCVVPEYIDEARMSTNLIRVVLDEKIVDPYYFAYLFKGSQLVSNKLRELCSGSTREFLNQKILHLLEFPLPSLKEQKEIVRIINQNFVFVKKLKKQILKARNYFDKLEQSILAKAFRGELIS